MRRLATIGVATACLLGATAIVAAGASASGALPVSPTSLGASTDALQVKPATIAYTGDGTGLLGGRNVRDRNSGIDWTKWTADVALGSGFNQLNNCTPSCAGGTFRGYPVKIELWRPRMLSGTLVYTRMTIFYEKSRPRGEQQHYTFTDTHIGAGYGWGPPTEEGYCVHTYGQPPEPSCKYIHTLP